MEGSISNYSFKQVVKVNRIDRWQVYRRLQELEIPCQCQTNQELTVEISNIATAVQVWSVVRQLNAERQDLIEILEECWHYRYHEL
ncbi:MAG: Asr1405/Asl0597 family protein [Cyanobacteria bacterium J06639_18]